MRLNTIYNTSPFHTAGNLYFHNNLYGSSIQDGAAIIVPSSSNMVFNSGSSPQLSNNLVWNNGATPENSNDGVWNNENER